MIGLANKSFRLEPNIFNRILRRIIGCKAQTCDGPTRLIAPLVDPRQVVAYFLGAMIAGSVPNQGNATIGVLSPEILQKSNGVLRIAGLQCLNQALLRADIHGPIVGLLAAFIRHRHLNPFVCFTPDIAADISPQQMAFVLKENDQLASANLIPMGL